MKAIYALMEFIVGTLLLRSAFAAQHNVIAPQLVREGVTERIVLNMHGISGRVKVVTSLRFDGIDVRTHEGMDAQKPIELDVKVNRRKRPIAGLNQVKYVNLLINVYDSIGVEIYSESINMRLTDTSGYIHVQTDRPIYRPTESLKARIIALTQYEEPEMSRDVEIIVRTPVDIAAIAKTIRRMPENRFIDYQYKIPEYPALGIWSVEARYSDEVETKWSVAKFAVQRYVLPTFNVKLFLKKKYILLRDNMEGEVIEGTITAQYSYGKPVSGYYFLTAKLIQEDIRFPLTFYKEPADLGKIARIVDGEQRFEIPIAAIMNLKAGNFDDLDGDGAKVIVEVSVTGEEDAAVETDASQPLVFIRSPYKIDIARMSKYYIPGMTFEIKADILDSVTLAPVAKKPFVIKGSDGERISKDESDENGQINEVVNIDSQAEQKYYEILIDDDAIPDANKASVSFTLKPYVSPSKSHLVLRTSEKIAEIGDKYFDIDVHHTTDAGELRYVIFARGLIVSTGVRETKAGSTATNFRIEITGNMTPSFRIFVYFFNDDEMVSNSLWVDVKDACKKELTVSVQREVEPGGHTTVTYEGPPNAVIGMSAVDRAAYFMYNESRLTRKAVFESFNEYDQGCIREGGEDARNVFEEGGLQVIGGIYSAKEEFSSQCHAAKTQRKKRDIHSIEAKLEKENELEKCIIDGYLPNLAGETCEERKSRVLEENSEDCGEAFHKACKEFKIGEFGKSNLPSVSVNAGGLKAIVTKARYDFKENMLWRTAVLDSDGTYVLQVPAKESITTFEFDTISMDKTYGFCVAETQDLLIFREIFIELKVPYSLKLMEQAEIRASVYNYGNRAENITLFVRLGEDFCSYFQPGVFSELITVHVEPSSARTSSFVVMPLRIPKNQVNNPLVIELKAEREGPVRKVYDQIKKSVPVEDGGLIRDIKDTHAIDLKGKREGGRYKFSIKLKFPPHHIPNTRKCFIYTYSNFMGPNIVFDSTTKQLRDIREILKKTLGGAEQNVAYVGSLVYAYRYLRGVGKISGGSDEQMELFSKMKEAYDNQINRYNTEEQAWAKYPDRAPSIWLCALVNRVMSQARKSNAEIPNDKICSSMKWLINQQEEDGGFNKRSKRPWWQINNLINNKLSLTAYVTVSLIESREVCPPLAKLVQMSIYEAAQYLKKHENDTLLENSYELALTTYAMALLEPENEFTARLKSKLRSKVKYSADHYLAFWDTKPADDGRKEESARDYWYRRYFGLAIDVEMTAYALMSLMHRGPKQPVTIDLLDLTRKVVLWLVEQRDENGVFRSAHDTIVGLQAMSEYMIWHKKVRPPPKKISLDLSIRGLERTEWQDKPTIIHLDERNENFTVPLAIPEKVIGRSFIHVIASGVGEASLSYRCTYRTIFDENKHQILVNASTEIETNVIKTLTGKESPIFLKLLIKISKPQGEPSGQSIVDVNLISGFEVDTQTLELLDNSVTVDGLIERYELANQKVILHLKEITDKPIKLAFRMKQTVVVRAPNPSTVTVYDYHEPSVRTSVFYSIPNSMAHLQTAAACKKNEGPRDLCRCAEGGCMKCRARVEQLKSTKCGVHLLASYTDKECKDKDCNKNKCDFCECNTCKDNKHDCFNRTKIACKSNYVYTITVVNAVTDLSEVFVEFQARISEIFKKGDDVYVRKQDSRKFMARKDCYMKCVDPDLDNVNHYIHEGGRYLVMGGAPDEAEDEEGDFEHRYRLDERTVIERIFPEEYCKSFRKKYEQKCQKEKKKKSSEKCEKYKTVIQACDSIKQLQADLERGCDNV